MELAPTLSFNKGRSVSVWITKALPGALGWELGNARKHTMKDNADTIIKASDTMEL